MDTPTGETALARALNDSQKLSDWYSDVGGMLYDSDSHAYDGEGAAPSWKDMHDEIARWKGKKPGKSARERIAHYRMVIAEHRRIAATIHQLERADAQRLAFLLLNRVTEQTSDMERQLWRRIEHAEGKPPGSLSRTPGEVA